MKKMAREFILVIGFILIIALAILLCGAEAVMDRNAWNNGHCAMCDNGEYHFANAEHLRSGQTLYYYSCDNCEHVIKLHHQR